MRQKRLTMNRGHGKTVFQLVCNTLDFITVPYFLMQGTALGAWRDKGFVPSERDIDIGFLQEDFDEFFSVMHCQFIALGFTTRVVSHPFSRPRALKISCTDYECPIKVDLCAYQRFEDLRFCSSNLEPYSIVHPASIMEPPYDCVKMYDMECNVPSPIEDYLALEYGSTWQTPIDCHISASRIYNFRRDQGITNDFLDTQEQSISRRP